MTAALDLRAKSPTARSEMSLAKWVRDALLAQILGGALLPGQRINEPDVAAQLQVSRVPVREALRELESSGLVVSRRNAGVFVRQIDAIEIRDLYQLRSLLDGFCGRMVALMPRAQRTPLLVQLKASIARMREASEQHKVQSYYAENLRFHWILVEAVGNRTLTDTYRGLVQKLHVSRLSNLSQDVGMQTSIAEHEHIVRTLQRSDAPTCEALLAKHVSDAYERLVVQTSTP
jgi:DNA-binding GntR family transcriptional regulator